MHVTTMLSDKYLAMLGEQGGKDWGARLFLFSLSLIAHAFVQVIERVDSDRRPAAHCQVGG